MEAAEVGFALAQADAVGAVVKEPGTICTISPKSAMGEVKFSMYVFETIDCGVTFLNEAAAGRRFARRWNRCRR